MLYNSYFDKETGYRFGTPGQSWRTGSTPWFIKSMLMYVYGLQPEIGGLNVKPCLPPSWKECAVEKDFRGCHYIIRYHQTEGEGNVKSITADGVKIEGTLLPYAAGKTIEVDVEIG
jgi:cellobiose phosphorylase